MTEPSYGWRYVCPKGMQGNLSIDDNIYLGSWYQPNTTQDTYDRLLAYYSDTNTIKLEIGIAGFWTDVRVTNGSGSGSDYEEPKSLVNNQTVPNSQGNGTVDGTVILARCSATYQNVSYSWTNSTTQPNLTIIDDSGELGDRAGSLAQSVLFSGYLDGSDFDLEQRNYLMKQIKTFDNMTISTVTQNLQSVTGILALSFLGGTFEPAPALALAIGSSEIVTEIQKAPLFVLVILNLWYAAFAACLGLLTIYIMRDHSTRQDILEVQKLLTINGLATSVTSVHEEWFDDVNARMCVEKIKGKWRLRVFTTSAPDDEDKALLDAEETIEQT